AGSAGLVAALFWLQERLPALVAPDGARTAPFHRLGLLAAAAAAAAALAQWRRFGRRREALVGSVALAASVGFLWTLGTLLPARRYTPFWYLHQGLRVVEYLVLLFGFLSAYLRLYRAAARSSEVRYRALVDGVHDYAIFFLDPRGAVMTWHAGAERITGYRAEEILGRDLSCLYDAAGPEAGRARRLVMVAAAEGRAEDEGWQVRRDGSRFWAHTVLTAIVDEAGRLAGFSGVTRDRTARKQAWDERASLLAREQAAYARLEATERRLRELLEGIGAIVWEADATTWQFSYVSPQAEALLGYPLAAWLGDCGFWASRVVHPDDREWAVAFCREQTAAGRDHEFEYRAVAADGRVVWLRDVVRVVCDDQGRPRRLRGVMVNVTDRKRVEEALAARARQQAGVAELGQRALAGGEPATLLADAAALVARTLEVAYSAVYELEQESGR
ncbi:MAG TPA: PAS domain S-box protein, partial [Thermodesulfobacteriota bacterium]|nr:PAS domain S-box protein [Thermodesulfobacteriota bacterium]